MAKAFKLINLEMEPGTVLGYIGPNGSGKTTTHHCLAGLFRTDSGEIHIFGRKNLPNHSRWKGDIGFVGNVHPFYEAWTAEKNLRFLSWFYPSWSAQRAKELAGRFRLPLEKKVRALSSGNRVKLSLVSALSLLFCCSAYVFYIILLVMFSDNPVIHVRALGILFGLNICAFSIIFMLRDVFLMSGRSRVLKFIGSYTTLFLLLLVSMLAGVWAFWITEQTGKPPAALVMLIDFIRAYNPFSGPYGVYRFLVFSLLLAGLSVVTFSRRSSFAE